MRSEHRALQLLPKRPFPGVIEVMGQIESIPFLQLLAKKFITTLSCLQFKIACTPVMGGEGIHHHFHLPFCSHFSHQLFFLLILFWPCSVVDMEKGEVR